MALMATPGFRTVYISAVDEPWLHGPKQIGHPDRQPGGEHFSVRDKKPWKDEEVQELIRLWDSGLHHRAIKEVLSTQGIPHSRDNIQRKLRALAKEGKLTRVSKRGGYRPKGNAS